MGRHQLRQAGPGAQRRPELGQPVILGARRQGLAAGKPRRGNTLRAAAQYPSKPLLIIDKAEGGLNTGPGTGIGTCTMVPGCRRRNLQWAAIAGITPRGCRRSRSASPPWSRPQTVRRSLRRANGPASASGSPQRRPTRWAVTSLYAQQHATLDSLHQRHDGVEVDVEHGGGGGGGGRHCQCAARCTHRVEVQVASERGHVSF